MTPERWQEVKDIFRSALEIEPARRAAFLDQACAGDELLRREVESLLRSHDESDSFMETPALENTEAAKMIVGAQSKLQPGQRVGHYEIVRLAGEGGMGEVYLAQDTKLGRKVALKFLPSFFTRDADRLRRFAQEARAASALNHPNIITIYEIPEANSTLMIAAEFVEGETLREHLIEGRLNLDATLHTAIQIADALAAAHKAGIIHRDIKPENIMIRLDGYVKVLDFGLAKLIEPVSPMSAAEAPTKQVKTGSVMIMGTVGYMSPEQARGLTVDARPDIFNLGVVIYEMVAGQKPFDGETPSDVLAAILKTEPPLLSHFAPEAPPELVRIVTKALRKDREQRYQVVRDLLLDLRSLKEELDFQTRLDQSVVPGKSGAVLAAAGGSHAMATGRAEPVTGSHRSYLLPALLVTLSLVVLMVLGLAVHRWRTPTTSAAIDSIAVLPFANVSNNPNAEYLSDGVAESIINSLSQLPQLKVMARSTVFRFKGRESDAQAVGKELGVRAVLTGRLSQQGDNLIISAELVNASDGTQLWGEQYNFAAGQSRNRTRSSDRRFASGSARGIGTSILRNITVGAVRKGVPACNES